MEKKEAYITRVEYKHSQHGFFWVRFLKGTNNSEKGEKQAHAVQHTFTDIEHGSRSKAFKAAKIYRNEVAKSLNIDLTKSQFCKHVTSGIAKKAVRTNTGIGGITNKSRVSKETGTECFFYVVNWQQLIDGKRRQKARNFGYKADDFEGQELAFKYAIRHRKQMLQQHYKG